MSDLSLKRTLLFTFLITCVATSLLATNPSSRYETRVVYDPQSTHMILFGGLTGIDSGTKKAYHLGDTWEWIGAGGRWVERFPAHSPEARSGHAMVYDSTRGQIVLFGGRNDTTDLNDTWVYKSADWTQLAPPNSPPGRILPGAAYDPIRDRIVLFGGTQTSADAKTLTPVHDTWEFDGSTWTQIGGEGPAVTKPLLAYDAARNQVIMLALDDKTATQMFTYDPAAGKWTQVTPTTLPPCVNEGMLTYQSTNQTLLYTGGVCTSSPATDETYEWDGSTWNKIDLTTSASRLFGAALAYDDSRQLAMMFGGTPIVGAPASDTWIYTVNSDDNSKKSWIIVSDTTRPGPRSLFSFTTDPVNNTIWMLGGVDEVNTFSDFWQYQNGDWQSVTADNAPTGCLTPNAAFDTDRQKLVVVCAASETFEWDGTTWKSFTGLKTQPPFHHFASMTYDPTLKKTVLFGGYDGSNYSDETWTWDGTSWNREKRNPAPARTHAAMWYDPALKKTVIYGGVGRITTTDRVTRYSDMWTFDGSGWTQLKPASGTPGMRYGAQFTVDPRSNHLLLFGGLRDDVTPAVPPATTPTETQVYADDMWEWDGSSWTQLHPDTVPPPRENGRMAYDPTRDEIVMFGGYAGQFFSDLWTYNPNTWKVRILDPIGARRRVTH